MCCPSGRLQFATKSCVHDMRFAFRQLRFAFLHRENLKRLKQQLIPAPNAEEKHEKRERLRKSQDQRTR